MFSRISAAELHAGALRVFSPREDRFIWMTPVEIIQMRCLESLFELTPSEARLLRDKAVRLQELINHHS